MKPRMIGCSESLWGKRLDSTSKSIKVQDVQWRKVGQAFIESVLLIHRCPARGVEELIKHGEYLEFYLFPTYAWEMVREWKPMQVFGTIHDVFIPIVEVSLKKLIGDRRFEFSQQVQAEEE